VENSMSVEEVQIFCMHSEDCIHAAVPERERDVFVNWDSEWVTVRIVVGGNVKALMLYPVAKISKVQLIMWDEEPEEEETSTLEDESVN
jgi:hypothetical protein